MTDHSSWVAREKAIHLLAILQGHGSDILHNVPATAADEDIITKELLHRSPAGNDLPISTLSSETLHEFAAVHHRQ
jgi:hypothetical protein